MNSIQDYRAMFDRLHAAMGDGMDDDMLVIEIEKMAATVGQLKAENAHLSAIAERHGYEKVEIFGPEFYHRNPVT